MERKRRSLPKSMYSRFMRRNLGAPDFCAPPALDRRTAAALGVALAAGCITRRSTSTWPPATRRCRRRNCRRPRRTTRPRPRPRPTTRASTSRSATCTSSNTSRSLAQAGIHASARAPARQSCRALGAGGLYESESQWAPAQEQYLAAVALKPTDPALSYPHSVRCSRRQQARMGRASNCAPRSGSNLKCAGPSGARQPAERVAQRHGRGRSRVLPRCARSIRICCRPLRRPLSCRRRRRPARRLPRSCRDASFRALRHAQAQAD